MTKGELIKLLVDDERPMKTEICAYAPIPHDTEHGRCEGYLMPIMGIDAKDGDIEINLWMLK
jgi:hypothetical protein